MNDYYKVSRDDMEGIAILGLSIAALLETTPDFEFVLGLISDNLTEEQIETAIEALAIKETE